MQTHAGSAFDNRVTLTFDLLTSQSMQTAMHRIPTEFGVDSSSRFPFIARIHRHKVTDATDHRTGEQLGWRVASVINE